MSFGVAGGIAFAVWAVQFQREGASHRLDLNGAKKFMDAFEKEVEKDRAYQDKVPNDEWGQNNGN